MYTLARNINITVATADSIQASWEPSNDAESATYHYIAYLWREGVDGGTREDCDRSTTASLSCVFGGLQPNTKHFFVIATCTPSGYCNHEEKVIFPYSVEVGPQAETMSIDNIESDAVSISWRPAVLPGDRVFKVIVDDIRPIPCPRPTPDDNDKHSCYLCGLTGDWKYKLQVFNCSSADDFSQCQPYTSSQTVRTLPRSPQQVYAVGRSADHMIVSWKVADDSAYGLYKHTATIRTGSTVPQQCNVLAKTSKDLTCEFHGLQPGAIYTISVTIFAGSGAVSRPSTFIYPAMRPMVKVAEVTTDTIKLIWNITESLTEKDIIVHLNEEAGPMCMSTDVSSSQRVCLIDGLSAGTVYEVQLFSVGVFGSPEFDIPVTRAQYILTRYSDSYEQPACSSALPIRMIDPWMTKSGVAHKMSPHSRADVIVDLNGGKYQHCDLLQVPHNQTCFLENQISTGDLESVWICLPPAGSSSFTKVARIQDLIKGKMKTSNKFFLHR
ncbi:unnamed protein product [Dibothriocephalus latus]|uniref:Fibronectin type-III domain-containing protein n=1 Tax=Dibothriocephalus latus TaxID=60516 RepID=A0A3P6UD84_DIBLA|nr:unnamed protein product [Dibothriocephalus latus]